MPDGIRTCLFKGFVEFDYLSFEHNLLLLNFERIVRIESGAYVLGAGRVDVALLRGKLHCRVVRRPRKAVASGGVVHQAEHEALLRLHKNLAEVEMVVEKH